MNARPKFELEPFHSGLQFLLHVFQIILEFKQYLELFSLHTLISLMYIGIPQI